jgi:hypothetical protein
VLPKFKLSPGQSLLWKSDKRVLCGVAGAQGGKTSLLVRWIKREILRHHGKGYNYILIGPTFRIIQQSLIPSWMQVSLGLGGTINRQDAAYNLPDGGTLFFRSSTDPDSVIGTPDVKAVGIDEAGKVSRGAYLAAVERCARLQGRICLITTPYALNWIVRDVIHPFERGEREDIFYTRWTSADNPTYPKEEFERLRLQLPARIFRMRYEGFHDKAEGLIFEDWSEDNWVHPFQVPKWKTVGGIDWGFDHPMALVVRVITPEKECFTVSIFKKAGLSIYQQMDVIEAKTKAFGVDFWSCGHDRPEMIAELNKRGIRAFPYFTMNLNLREVNSGNARHAELIKSRQLKAFKGIDQWQELEDEYQTYIWDKDETEEWRGRERPINENDDLMAAERYCTVGSCHMLPYMVSKSKPPIGWASRIDRWSPKIERKSIDDW